MSITGTVAMGTVAVMVAGAMALATLVPGLGYLGHPTMVDPTTGTGHPTTGHPMDPLTRGHPTVVDRSTGRPTTTTVVGEAVAVVAAVVAVVAGAVASADSGGSSRRWLPPAKTLT